MVPDFYPLYVFLMLVTVLLVCLLNVCHLKLIITFRAMVPEAGGYFHVALALITCYFHVSPPEATFFELIGRLIFLAPSGYDVKIPPRPRPAQDDFSHQEENFV